MRGHLRHVVRGRTGHAIQNAAVLVYEHDTLDEIADMFDADAGGAPLASPLFTNDQGEIEAWVAAPRRVDLRITDNDDEAFYAGNPALLVSFAPYTEVEDAIAIEHLGDPSDAHDASAISFNPAGTPSLTSLDVQTAVAELDTKKAGLGLANVFTVGAQDVGAGAGRGLKFGADVLLKSGGANILNLRNVADSQNADLTLGLLQARTQVSGGTASLIPAGVYHYLLNNTAASAALVVRGAASQSGSLQEWQDSAGVVKTKVGTGGVDVTGFVSATGVLQTNSSLKAGPTALASSTSHQLSAIAAADKVLAVRGAASQSGDLQQWQSSAASVLGAMWATGDFVATALRVGPTDAATRVFMGTLAGGIGIELGPGNAARDTNLYRSASDKLKTDDSLIVAGRFAVGESDTVAGVKAAIRNDSAGDIVLRLRAAASQSANIQEWQDSAGVVLARINSAGSMMGNDFRTHQNGFTRGAEEAGGGHLYLRKATSTPANPGAEVGKLYFRDGTNPGTLKLVVRAGAAGAETTILDNIPQS